MTENTPGHLRYALAVKRGLVDPYKSCPPTTMTRTTCPCWARHFRDGKDPVPKHRVLPR